MPSEKSPRERLKNAVIILPEAQAREVRELLGTVLELDLANKGGLIALYNQVSDALRLPRHQANPVAGELPHLHDSRVAAQEVRQTERKSHETTYGNYVEATSTALSDPGLMPPDASKIINRKLPETPAAESKQSPKGSAVAAQIQTDGTPVDTTIQPESPAVNNARDAIDWGLANAQRRRDDAVAIFVSIMRAGMQLYERGSPPEKLRGDKKPPKQETTAPDVLRAQGMSLLAAGIYGCFRIGMTGSDIRGIDGKLVDFLYEYHHDVPNQADETSLHDLFIDPRFAPTEMFPQWLLRLREEGLRKRDETVAKLRTPRKETPKWPPPPEDEW